MKKEFVSMHDGVEAFNIKMKMEIVPMSEQIKIKNARIHNLNGVDVTISKHKLTVITGVIGGI